MSDVVYVSVAVDVSRQDLQDVTDVLVNAGFAYDDAVEGFVLGGAWT